MTEAIEIAQLLPHAAPMVLLDQLLAADATTITCALAVRADGLFDSDGSVPAYLGVEYMAQAVAAFSGLEQRRLGQPARVGFLLGTRRFETSVASLAVGTQLQVRAEKLIRGSNGMASFACTVSGAGVAQSATLSVFEPGDDAVRAMLEGESE